MFSLIDKQGVFIYSDKSLVSYMYCNIFGSFGVCISKFLFFFFFGVAVSREGFPLVAVLRDCPSCDGRVAHRGGLSLRSSALGPTRFVSCGAQAQFLHSMWDLSRPRIKSMSPALAQGFLSTVLPGKTLQGLNSIFS